MASARGQHATTIEKTWGDDETGRRVIKAFNEHGMQALGVKSRRPPQYIL